MVQIRAMHCTCCAFTTPLPWYLDSTNAKTSPRFVSGAKHLQRQLTAVATDTARFPWFSLTIMDNYGDTGVISFHPLSLHDLYGLTSCSPARVQASSIPLASGMGWQRLRQWHPTDLRSESSSRCCSSPSLPH